MAIFNPVMSICSEMFALPDFIKSPLLCLGVQDIEKSFIPGVIPDEFKFDTLGDLFRARGIECYELDPFDDRAKMNNNLNEPINEVLYEMFSTVLDYGCVEHIFDTKTVIENCMRMVKVGGLYAVHTPVRNFANHGLHTFHPELFPSVMRANNFEVIFEKYTTSTAREVDMGSEESVDTIGWFVGRKLKSLDKFISPEQKRYEPK